MIKGKPKGFNSGFNAEEFKCVNQRSFQIINRNFNITNGSFGNSQSVISMFDDSCISPCTNIGKTEIF